MTGTDIVPRTPQQQLVALVRGPQFMEQIAMVLPPTVTPERFQRIACTAILTNPDLTTKISDRESLLRAFVQAAADGLMPDGREGAIVGRGGKAVWQPMIWGFRRQIADYGWSLVTRAVYEADEFEWVDEPHSRLHRQARPGVDRGNIIGAYAIATHRDGRELQLFMPWEDIAKRRDVATTKAIWDKWPAEMAAKTPGRALVKKLPLAESDRERLLRVLDASDLEHGEAATALYGPPPGGTPALSAGANVDAASTTPDTSRDADVADVHQQAEPAAATETPAAGSAPDLVDPDEIEFGEAFDGEDDATIAAAREAAVFTIPAGRLAGNTLQEAFDAGEEQWFRAAVHKVKTPEYRDAVRAFCRVYLPDALNGIEEQAA